MRSATRARDKRTRPSVGQSAKGKKLSPSVTKCRLRGGRKRATLGAIGKALGTVRAGGRAIMAEVVRMLGKEHTDMAILLDLLERQAVAGSSPAERASTLS